MHHHRARFVLNSISLQLIAADSSQSSLFRNSWLEWAPVSLSGLEEGDENAFLIAAP